MTRNNLIFFCKYMIEEDCYTTPFVEYDNAIAIKYYAELPINKNSVTKL